MLYPIALPLACAGMAAALLGVNNTSDPFITLSFLALPVIPDVRLTDMGVFDVTNMRFLQKPED